MTFDPELDGLDRVQRPPGPIKMLACLAFWALSIIITFTIVVLAYTVLGAAFP